MQLDADRSRNGEIAYVQARDLGTIGGLGTEARARAWIASRTLWITRSGGGAHQVRAAGKGIYQPQWGHDSRHLLFVRENVLWLLDLRGGTSRRVLGPFPQAQDPFGFYGHVQWPVSWAWNG